MKDDFRSQSRPLEGSQVGGHLERWRTSPPLLSLLEPGWAEDQSVYVEMYKICFDNAASDDVVVVPDLKLWRLEVTSQKDSEFWSKERADEGKVEAVRPRQFGGIGVVGSQNGSLGTSQLRKTLEVFRMFRLVFPRECLEE